jgi:hypothetical protein
VQFGEEVHTVTWTFIRRPGGNLMLKLKTHTYGLLFVVVGAIAATGGQFTVR